MNRTDDDDAIMQRLDNMTTPSKPFIRGRSNGLGLKIAHSLRDTFDAKCQFERKGSVFDDKILHVSDIDILVFIESGVGLATAMAHILSAFNLHPFTVMTRDLRGSEVEWKTNVLPDEAFDESIETIAVSMPLSMGKHTLPLDLTMTSKLKGRDEPIDHRIQKLDANIKTGKFDKALQRIRPLLTRLSASREARDAVTAAMNERTGLVRFVQKQLQLSVDSKRITPAVAELGVESGDELEHALMVAKSRNAIEAKDVIVEFIDEIMAAVECGVFEEAMRSALAPFVRQVVAIKDAPADNDFIERLHTAWHLDRRVHSIRKQIDDNAGNGLIEDVLSLHLYNAEEQAERHRAVRLGTVGYFVFA